MSDIFGMIGRKLAVNDEDDATSSRTTTNQVINTLFINIFLLGLLSTLFEIFRRKKSIYLNRYVKRFIETGRVPPAPSKVPYSWIWHILHVPEHELLDMIGLDGYMCIRFIVVCFRTACFCSIWGVLILVPIYGTAQPGETNLGGWDRFTIANIPNEPAGRLLAAVFMCYMFSGFFCQLMYIEYKNFVGKRVLYLVNGDKDTPVQTYYTVMVERVPAALRSGPMLAGFFERLYPGEFHSAEVAMDLHELESITAKRRRIRNKLEKYIALCWASQQRPLVWKRPNSLPDFPVPVVHNKVAQDFGYEVVDAIEFYSKSLNLFNERVKSMQKVHFEQRHRVDELEEMRLMQIQKQLQDHTTNAMKHVSSRFADFTKGNNFKIPIKATAVNSDDDDEETLTQLTDKRRNSIMNLSPMLMRLTSRSHKNNNDPAEISMSPTSPLTNNDVSREERRARMSEDLESGRSSSVSSDGESQAARIAREQALKMREAMSQGANAMSQGANVVQLATKSGLEGIGKEGVKTAEFAAKGALRGVLEATRALELLTFGAQYRVSTTAFVTFKTRKAASSCHQMLLSHEYYTMEVTSAPNPNGLVWENVSIPQSQINIRRSIADGTLIVGALFWSIVVTAISAVSNMQSISRVIPSLQHYSDTQLYQFANSYLAIALLLILLAILPFVFDFIARYYEGLKTESEIQNSIMTRYFYYQLANIYVSVGLGSVASSLHEVLANPANILTILGASVPTFSTYFACLVIVKTMTAVPIEMLRIIPLLDILSVSMCMDKRRCTRRELRTGAFADPPMLYGWIYPSIMMVLMIMMTYATISPLILPLCAFYFAMAYLMYKYQLLYVYINSYQSGGYMWYAVFNRSMVVLMAGVCTLLCYLAIRMSYTSAPFYLLLPLPGLIILFWHHCEKRIRGPAMTLSMEGAMELDQEVTAAKLRGDPTPHDKFSNQCFRQPSLNEGKLKPSLYRHGKPMLPESVYGRAAMGSFRRASMSGSQHSPKFGGHNTGFVEDPNGGKVFLVSPLAATGINPLHSHSAHNEADEEAQREQQQAQRNRADSVMDVEGDDIDEFEEEAEYPKDVDAAVDALLSDENKKTAVNAVSEQISSLRRSSVMGSMPAVASVVPGFRRSTHSTHRRDSDAAMSPDSMRVHTFTSRDLDEMDAVEAEEKKQLSPTPYQPLLKGYGSV